VLDEGDTTLGLADTTKAPGFLRYGLSGGAPQFVFKDSSLASVSGIAADQDGNVYVSGIGKEFVRDDPTDTRKTTYKYVSRIDRYLAAQGYVRDKTFFVDEGQGVGTVFQPGDIYVDPGVPLDFIYVADTGKDIGQKLTYVANNAGNPLPSVSIDAAGSGLTALQPQDIGGDRQGFIYLADTGRHRVLRFDTDGNYVQRVDIETDLDSDSLHVPVAMSCDDSLVYVADQATGKVASYKRRK
jgi:DNA-binding beta-propeller fold protein YncE